MKKKFNLITVICLIAMISFGSFTFAYAASEVDAASAIGQYTIQIHLGDNDYNGSTVELLKKDGTFVNSWELKEKGKLVADLPPGSYTLREIIEINGYEIPRMSNIMVGEAIIVPYDPNPETISPSFDPSDYLPTDPLEPSFPDYYYDIFQQWIDEQN